MAPRRRWYVWLAWTVLAIGLAAAGCSPSASPAAPRSGPASDEQAVADFYRGKTIQLVVATGAGGGFDIYSRQIAPYLSKHTPGNPTIVVDNKPGAGHMIGMNYVYNMAPRNGLAIGNATGGLAIAQVFGARGVEFDMTKLDYLGIPATETMVMIVSREAGVQRLEELLGPGSKQLVLGGTGPGSLQEDLPVLLRDVLGANVKIVSGYEGTSSMKIALERGEIQGFFNTWESSKSTDRAKFDNGEWLLLTQFSETPHRDLPSVPGILSFARTDDERQLMRYGGVLRNLIRSYFLPPGVPAERVRALQEAFSATMADPEFLAQAERSGLDVNPLSGAEVKRDFTAFLSMPDDVKARLRPLLQPGS
jgi:tripartite-type tricarboxylate transporter receptor subunit TctC